MTDIVATCLNKVNFPGQHGIPSLSDGSGMSDYRIESIYGNAIGNVEFDLNFAPSVPQFILSNTEIVSSPPFYNISRISSNSFRVIQNNEKIFSEIFDFALFNDDGTVNRIVDEKDIDNSFKKSPVSFIPPDNEVIDSVFTVRYQYTAAVGSGMVAVDANRNVDINQFVYWDWEPAINKLRLYILQGDY